MRAFLRQTPQLSGLGFKFAGTTTSIAEEDPKLAGLVLRAAQSKKFQRSLENTKPAGWDEALPFAALPGPKPLPVIGNFWRFWPVVGEYYNKPLLTFYQDMHRQYGDILILKGVPGRVPLVFAYDPKDMETLLRSSNVLPLRRGMLAIVHYQQNMDSAIYKELKGLLSLQGEEWYKLRKQVNPIMMQPLVMRQYVTKIQSISQQLVDNMIYFAGKNSSNEMADDFQVELYKWALETVAIIGLDRRLGCLDRDGDENCEHRRYIRCMMDIFELFFHLEVKPPIWRYIRTPSYMKFVKRMNFVTDYTKRQIDEALNRPVDPSVPESQWSVVRRLAKEDKNVAYVMVTDMLMAGIDTTGKTLAAILYFLAKNPKKQALLREEAMRVLPNKDSTLTVDDLFNIPYTQAVIKESNRIAPVAIGNLRTTVKDLVLGGYQIPRFTDVTTLTVVSSNNECQFKDPEKFIPERWIRKIDGEYNYKNAHPFAFMPFGYGSRSCVGIRLANLELEVTTLKIIRNLELSWHKPDAKFIGYFLYGIVSPLNFTVKPIDH